MAYTIRAPRRITHRYNDSFSRLDKYDYGQMVELKVLGVTREAPPVSHDDGGAIRFRVVAKRGESQDLVKAAIYDRFKVGGCGHDYDCCGCAFTTVLVDRVTHRSREYRVEVYTGYNY